jgi:uncharacterized protein (UPF0332 family)
LRIKRPDNKNALSLIESAKKDMKYTLSLEINEQSASTIVRNIYESFRKLGDAILTHKGIESQDHVAPIKELMAIKVNTTRPVNLLDNMRRLRHNVNYYGYNPKIIEVVNVVSLAKDLFEPLTKEIEKKINGK